MKKEMNKQKGKRKTSFGENSLEAPWDASHNEIKIKDVSDGENLSKAPKDGDFILPPQEHRPPISSVLIEETRPVNINLTKTPHITYIVASLQNEQANLLIEVLHENLGCFTWSYQDMPGLDPKLAVHHLTADPTAKPIKQNLHNMHLKVDLLVKVELEKFLEAKIIRPIDYSKWISYMVPVTKPFGDIRICTNFRDLNKAYLKDDFLLPNIDMIVDVTTGHELLSLMDGFSGYNHIQIGRCIF